MKREAIELYCQEHSAQKMCRVLGLAESAYYQWKRRRAEQEEKAEAEKLLAKLMRAVFEENNSCYGYRRIGNELNKGMIYLSEPMVRRIMRENGIYPVSSIKFKPSSKGKVTGRFLENLLKQDFDVKEINKVWAGDITYIKTQLGWVYLAIVIDLFNREIIGYAIGKKNDAELVKRALANALARTGASGKEVIFHSDRGCQYSSKSFQKMLDKHGLLGSVSRPGCPYDNAPTESFISSAKRECIYRKEYADINAVERDIFQYIELFYNRKRSHSALGYMSPVEYRTIRVA